MRTRIIASLCTLMLSGPALAQDEQETTEEQTEGVEGGETEGAEVVREEGDQVRMTPPPGPGQAVAPGEVHTVVSGDTLWDLSQSYLGSPWYWPKVWSYNPEIANPHWIYPGNKIRFFPAGEEVPSRVEVGEAPQALAEDPELDAPTEFDDQEGRVTAAGKIGYTPKGTTAHLLQGFVTTRELDEAGTIAGSFSETLMLSYPEQVYIKFKNRNDVQVGADYVVFKTIGDVVHPDSKAKLGHLTHFLGKVRVVKMDQNFVTAQITDTWDEINRGDLIGPASEDFLLRVQPRPNEKAVKGTLVEMMIPYLTIAGEFQSVIIDQGSSAGVQVGNTFTVIRQQDLGGNFMEPQKEQDKKWPEEAIATCMVIDVKDRASVCLMTRSIREVVEGDRVVMKVDAAPTASR